MSEDEFIVVYTVCKLLGFLNLQIHFFLQFYKLLTMIYSNSLFPIFSLFFLSSTPISICGTPRFVLYVSMFLCFSSLYLPGLIGFG